jgi:hypothetical protein
MRDPISVNIVADTDRMAKELAYAVRRYPGFGNLPRVNIVGDGETPKTKADITFLAGLPILKSIKMAEEICKHDPNSKNIFIPPNNEIPIELLAATRDGKFYDAALFTEVDEIHSALERTRKSAGIFKPLTIGQIGAGPLGEGFAKLASQSQAVSRLLIYSSRGRKRIKEVKASCGAGREKIEYIDLEEIALSANPDIIFMMAGARDADGKRFDYSAYTERAQTTDIIFQNSKERADRILMALQDFTGAVCIMDNPPEDYCKRRVEHFGGNPRKTFSIAIDHSRNLTRLVEELAHGLILQEFIDSTGVSAYLTGGSKEAIKKYLAGIGVHKDLGQINREDIKNYFLIGVHGGESYSFLDSCEVNGVPLVEKIENSGICINDWRRRFDASNANFGLELMKNSNGDSLTEVPSYMLEAVKRIAAYQNEPGVAITMERSYRDKPIWVASNFGNEFLYSPSGVSVASRVKLDLKAGRRPGLAYILAEAQNTQERRALEECLAGK